MAKKREYTFTNYISIDGAPPVPMDSLTEEQKEYCARKMAQNIGRTLSRYFTQHPEEYDRCVENGLLMSVEEAKAKYGDDILLDIPEA